MSQTRGVRLADPVGLYEIAERLGVRQQLAYTWRQRGVLPEPKFELAMGPVWDWPTIEAWARDTGRLT